MCKSGIYSVHRSGPTDSKKPTAIFLNNKLKEWDSAKICGKILLIDRVMDALRT